MIVTSNEILKLYDICIADRILYMLFKCQAVSNFSVFRNFLVGVLIWTPNQVKFNSLYGFVPSSEGDRNL